MSPAKCSISSFSLNCRRQPKVSREKCVRECLTACVCVFDMVPSSTNTVANFVCAFEWRIFDSVPPLPLALCPSGLSETLPGCLRRIRAFLFTIVLTFHSFLLYAVNNFLFLLSSVIAECREPPTRCVCECMCALCVCSCVRVVVCLSRCTLSSKAYTSTCACNYANSQLREMNCVLPL